MNIFNSIKWRLQLWYGLILICVLAGFGVTAYQLERGRQVRRLDEELHRRIGVLGDSLHRPPPRLGNRGRDFLNPPPQDAAPEDAPEFQRRPPAFRLDPENAALFGTNDAHGFYFVILRPTPEEGLRTVAHSENFSLQITNLLDAIGIDLPKVPVGAGPKRFSPPKTVWVGDERRVFEILPSGEIIHIGGSFRPERIELRKSAVELVSVGGLILLVGLAGGWWLVNRSLKPISQISRTAAKISAGDLSQRIDTEETESELGQLAAVLNSTFARLEAAFAQQKQFASDAAHELRTPVSVILTQTQMTLSRERDAASYKQTVEACQRAAQRMRKLIESLLELARFDAGQEVMKRLKFDVSKTVFESVELVQPLADEKRVKILSEISPLEITGDAERLGQVANNLLTNAIQYNQPDGEVRVKLGGKSGLAVLEIANTGQGIAGEDLPRVFERFYRADKSRTGAGNSGLGLSICKAIVEAHGGTIEVASENNSTKFTVRLPV